MKGMPRSLNKKAGTDGDWYWRSAFKSEVWEYRVTIELWCTERNSEKYGMMGGLVQRPGQFQWYRYRYRYRLLIGQRGSRSWAFDWPVWFQQLKVCQSAPQNLSKKRTPAVVAVDLCCVAAVKLYHAPLGLAKSWVPFCTSMFLGPWAERWTVEFNL